MDGSTLSDSRALGSDGDKVYMVVWLCVVLSISASQSIASWWFLAIVPLAAVLHTALGADLAVVGVTLAFA